VGSFTVPNLPPFEAGEVIVAKKKKPRRPPPFDNHIVLRADYDDRLHPDESDEEVEARTRVLDAMFGAPASVKRYFLAGVDRRTGGDGKATPTPFITHVGGRSYATTAHDSVEVTEEEHKVLQAFAKTRRAMTQGEIEDEADVTNVSRIVRRLVTAYSGRFATAVRRPGRKGKGGYLIHVRRVATDEG